MPASHPERFMRRFCVLASLLAALPAVGRAQQPTPDQARALLQSRPDLGARIRSYLANSGLTPDQVRARLNAAGYPAGLLDAYLGSSSAAGTGAQVDGQVLDALRALGFQSEEDRPLMAADSVAGRPGSQRRDLPTTSDSVPIFGLDVFHRVSTQFQPVVTGPVDPSYRLGPGDVLVLILTGDVELAHTLEVTREGFVVIPQVGQIYVSGLTLASLDNLLYTRLGRVYSGVRRGAGASTRFQVTVARLRTNQVFVIGDVARPGSYQVSSAGTVLTALYLAGGPTEKGSFRRVEIRRGGALVDSLDVYDYLLRGNAAHDVRLESGDVIFVPVHGPRVEVAGAVVRPAYYELARGETLRDLIAAAGGFDPAALRRRIQIERILPPAQRGTGGRDRVLIDLAESELGDSLAPGFPLVGGDRVKVFRIAERRRNVVTVQGDVWTAGPVGYTAGMRLSDAIRLAGGPQADVYLGQILITRLNPDSTRAQLRSAFRDSTGAVTVDLPLREDDQITVFSRTTFRPERYVVVTGAVKRPGRIRYREGMTLKDAVLEADGLTEDAWLAEAEIARLPADRAAGVLATTFRAPMDSTYVFDRGPDGKYDGPPGLPAPAGGAPETRLEPYDDVLVMRQPDWELQRTVTLTGQVRFPGRYALLTKSDRIRDLIQRAGGLTREAYPLGAGLFRRPPSSPTDLRLLGRLAAQADSGKPDSLSAYPDSLRLGTALAQRVGLDLSLALERPDARQNIVMQAGDSVDIPEFDPTVRILGAVNSPTRVLLQPGWDVDDYVAAAGGYSRMADRGRAYVVQPSGRLESVKRRFLLPDSKPKPKAGGTVFVPERDPSDKKDWAGFLGSVAQILASSVTILVVATKL
jgi:polysaccharide biosynthesis/export protein